MKKIFLNLILTIAISLSASSQTLQNVYFAQTHVVEPDYIIPPLNEKLTFIGNREALIKANIVSPSAALAPNVSAKLSLNGSTMAVNLTGPTNLPVSFNANFGEVQHKFDDSFTGVIPKEWMKQGLNVSIEIDGTPVKNYDLNIGSPNKILLQMFDFHYFGLAYKPFKNGWLEAFQSKLPVSEIELNRIPNIVFKEVVILPRAGKKAVKVTSKQDYLDQTGIKFDGETATSASWTSALFNASGRLNRGLYVFYGNYYGVRGDGRGGNFTAVGPDGLPGILIHELGHGFGLGHSSGYNGDMFGIYGGTIAGQSHAGPIWAYDTPTKTFIKPTRGGVVPLTYKNDPMQGGNTRQEPGYMFDHFSDRNIQRMRNIIENATVVYKNGNYAKWDPATYDYTKIQENIGNISYPVQIDVDVISILLAASSRTAEANIVYPPIGPYKGGLIQVFDPRDANDRANAATFYCKFQRSVGCDTTLKITQGGVEKYVMVEMSLDPSLAETDVKSFVTKAVNLPASDGEVTKVELLATPDVEINGLPTNPTVLYTWNKNLLSNQNFDASNNLDLYQINKTTLRINGGSNENKGVLKIISMSGKVVFSQAINVQNTTDINIPNLSQGIYIAKFISENTNFSKKLAIY